MKIMDTDICLNVSCGPTADLGAKKIQRSKTEFFKPHVKRLAKKIATNANRQKTTEKISPATKTRVKQKSLSVIVAKNVERSKTLNFGKKKIDKNTKSSTEKKNSSFEESAKPSFAAPSKENALKTILAKPRTENRPKKSLSDIFSQKSSDSQPLILAPSFTNDKVSAEKKVEKFPHAKNVILMDSGDSRFGGKRRQNKNHTVSNSDSTNKHQESSYKSSSKISSLFSNNPEVPNIGQRLVKPVNEAVFSEATFQDLGFHSYTVSNLEQCMNITKSTTVQRKAIPVVLSGKNVLVRSQTGSGKTLSYALPIVEKLHAIRPKLVRNSGLRALVVVPTRELALQTYECFLKLVKPFTWIVAGYLVGGEKRKAEKARLRRGCTILVATPGRLLDHIQHTESLKLNQVKFFVLDEADRMLDMGYEKDISGIVNALNGQFISENEKSSYDPLALIRGNSKKSIENCEEDIKEAKSEENLENDSKEKSDDEDSQTSEKPEYHSGSDSDDQEFPIGKKSKNAPSKRKEKIEPAASEPDDVEGALESSLSSARQTILLSATLTAAVEKLAGLTMTNPVFIDAAQDNLNEVGGDLRETNEDLVVPQGVTQSYIVTPPKLRMVTLSAYIAGKCQVAGQHKILVFMATQDMIDYHADILSTVLGKPSDDNDDDSDPLVDVEFFKLHGSMSQKERTEVFKTFRKARSGVLLCTDVASRGLDLPKVDTIIQYTGPLSARDYVHRIGRTARAGTSGVSTIFLTPPEIDFVRMLESRRIRIKQEDMNDVLDKLMGPLSKYHSVQATATALQNEFENLVLENKKFHTKACKAYLSWIRFYSSYPHDMREIFNRKDLNLGHYAKSFALRDPPQRIGGIGKTISEKEPSKPQHNNRLSNERPKGQAQKRANQSGSERKPGMFKKSRMLNISEYGSGLEPGKKSKK